MSLSGTVSCSPVATLLPKVDRAAAVASRLLHDRRLRPAWWDEGGGMAFVPLAVRPAGPLYRATVRTAHGPLEACLCAPGRASLAVVSSLPAGTPAEWAELAAEAALQPVLQGLAGLGIEDVQVGGLAPWAGEHEAVPPTGWVQLQLEGRAMGAFVCTRTPDALVQQLRDRLAPPRFQSRFARSLGLAGQVQLAMRPVRRAVLDSLEPGDVLLLAAVGTEPGATCHVAFGARSGRRWQAAAAVDDTYITIQGAGRMFDPEASDDVAIASDEAPVAAPPDLEVPVRFEVETVAVPLAEIESMAPGYVIELATPLAGASLRLVACGQVIGRAELVAVGDRLGARIIDMASRDAERTRR